VEVGHDALHQLELVVTRLSEQVAGLTGTFVGMKAASAKDFEQFFALRRTYFLNNLAFSPDSREISYVHDGSGQFNLWSSPVEGGFPRQLTTRDEEAVQQPRLPGTHAPHRSNVLDVTANRLHLEVVVARSGSTGGSNSFDPADGDRRLRRS